MSIPPRNILIATDLTARCDRAMDRAASLMKQYGSRLIALHVIEPVRDFAAISRMSFLYRHLPDRRLVEKAMRRLSESLDGLGPQASALVKTGVPHELILKTAREENCDFLVIGFARNDAFGRFTLGKTADALVQKAGQPILFVSEKGGTPYKNIVVLTDLSDISRRVLMLTSALFPDMPLSVLYPFSVYRSSSSGDREGYIGRMRAVAQGDLMKFLESAVLPESRRGRINTVAEFGKAPALLRDLTRLTDTDLVALGYGTRRFLPDFFWGSEAKQIISSIYCDALIVR